MVQTQDKSCLDKAFLAVNDWEMADADEQDIQESAVGDGDGRRALGSHGVDPGFDFP
ncbi:hypothetical protein D3C71_2146350 [compost metagenome]